MLRELSLVHMILNIWSLVWKVIELASYFYIITKTIRFTIGSDVILKKARAADFFFLILSKLSCDNLWYLGFGLLFSLLSQWQVSEPRVQPQKHGMFWDQHEEHSHFIAVGWGFFWKFTLLWNSVTLSERVYFLLVFSTSLLWFENGL